MSKNEGRKEKKENERHKEWNKKIQKERTK
jgi:hypothetical protein